MPRGAKRKQADDIQTPQKRLRTSKVLPTPPESDSSNVHQTPLNPVQEAADAMDIDVSETRRDEDAEAELYITVKAADGTRIRKRRAVTHHFIARSNISPVILDVLDEDPTWSLQEFKRRFKIGLTIGLSFDKTELALEIMLVERAKRALATTSKRARRAFLRHFASESDEET